MPARLTAPPIPISDSGVHATLVRSALATFEELIAPLSAEELASYYADSKQLARLLGLPEDAIPPDYGAFNRYFDAMVEGPALAVDETGVSLARAVLRPPIRLIPGFLLRWHGLATTALLPPRLRERYGLPWGDDERKAWDVVRARVKLVVSRLPGALRVAPFALWAERRFRRSRRLSVLRENRVRAGSSGL